MDGKITNELMFHHLGIVVEINEGKNILNNLIGPMKWVNNFRQSPISKYALAKQIIQIYFELIEPLEEGSPIDKVLNDKKIF